MLDGAPELPESNSIDSVGIRGRWFHVQVLRLTRANWSVDGGAYLQSED